MHVVPHGHELLLEGGERPRVEYLRRQWHEEVCLALGTHHRDGAAIPGRHLDQLDQTCELGRVGTKVVSDVGDAGHSHFVQRICHGGEIFVQDGDGKRVESVAPRPVPSAERRHAADSAAIADHSSV